MSHTIVQQELERFRDDALYVDEHRDELFQRYPERWVAILHRQVVANDRDPKRLLKKLEKKGIAPGRAYRAHLSSKEELLILAGYGAVTPIKRPEDFAAVRQAVEKAIGQAAAAKRRSATVTR